ncbi:hypothetical protein [Nonomuraea sp. NPDC050783]|uniref:hypothetical protein n=1 Tax=Nonomuraea sp. NPDC050783 TaxID=3154634 RepID=UPI0034678B15
MRPLESAEEPAHEIGISGEALLARLAPLPYPRRMRALALHARRLAGTPRLRALLDELSAGGRDARRAALHLAMAGRDLGFVEHVLAGPDLALRRAALRAVRTLPVPDAAVAAALRDAPAELRLAVHRTLVQTRRQALAESLLPDVHARWGPREAAVLLPACGAGTVARWLPEVAHAVTSWTALAARHPGAVMAAAGQELSAGADPWSWWRRRGAGVLLAAPAEPVRMLELLERHDLRHVVPLLPASVLNALFRTDTARAARALFGDPRPGWRGLSGALLRHLRSATNEEIVALAATRHRPGRVLRWLPPARRTAVFEAMAARRGGSARLWAMEFLEWLPPERAAREARRMLDWHASVWHSARGRLDDPALPLKLTSYLPYEEAAGVLREAALSGDPRRRGLARTLLVRAAARTRDREALRAVLDELALRTAGEQDPLRGELLAAVRDDVPPALLDDACAGALERLARAAAGAPDSSPATREALRGLARRVLRHADPAAAPGLVSWAMGVYGKLVARHGADGLGPVPAGAPAQNRHRRRGFPPGGGEAYRLDRVLRAGQEHDLLAVLRPYLRAAREREDFALAVRLARALGRRAGGSVELQGDLRAAVRTAPVPLAREAAALWLAPVPARRRAAPGGGHTATAGEREARIVELVQEDPSAVRLPAVWRTVARRRTDLLPAALDGERPGRAAEDAPGRARRFAEDTPEQAGRFAEDAPEQAGRFAEDTPGRGGRFAEGVWVPPVARGDAGRWTPGQRERVRGRLVAVVRDERLPVAVRAAAVQAAGRTGGTLDLLAAWAAGREESMVLAETAVTAMAEAGAPGRAVPLLLRHAGGPASHVAVAALARCCRAVAPSLLGPLLEAALTGPGGKVTLRKLAARQLGRNRPPGAVDVLLRAWADPGLHRDVRVAVASVLRDLPEDPRTLEALGEAAGRYAGELMSRTLFQAHPLDLPPGLRPRYAELVRRLLMAAGLPGVRFRGAKAFGEWARWYRGDLGEVVEAAADPRAPEEATDVFLALLRGGMIGDQVLGVLARLADAVPGEGLETPARARLEVVVERLAGWQDEGGPWPRLAREAMRLLADRPLLLPQAVHLALALLPAAAADCGGPADCGGAEWGEALSEVVELVRGRPVLAAHAAGRAAHELLGEYADRPVPPDAVPPVVRRLVARGDLAGAWFAVELTRAGGKRTGWADPWPALLRDLRDSPHLEVRQEAWDTRAAT